MTDSLLSPRTVGNIYLLKANGMSYADNAWLAPWGHTFVFMVAACRDARILLTSEPGKTSGTDAYEILLGGWDNTKSAILAGSMVYDILGGTCGI